ncbi:hypothetical protein Taro_052575 [Colocasia esculenta]|uniref:Uncharacterized protein n=1 Tax=Colocasia esculenta TaxID=4460 RepID=A0A843XJ13_COLES|nr:hypothetical protein [Colocasia esculenta]
MYFDTEIRTRRTQPPRNDDGGDSNVSDRLFVFKCLGRAFRYSSTRALEDRELVAAEIYVFMNCAELDPYIEYGTWRTESDDFHLRRLRVRVPVHVGPPVDRDCLPVYASHPGDRQSLAVERWAFPEADFTVLSFAVDSKEVAVDSPCQISISGFWTEALVDRNAASSVPTAVPAPSTKTIAKRPFKRARPSKSRLIKGGTSSAASPSHRPSLPLSPPTGPSPLEWGRFSTLAGATSRPASMKSSDLVD